MRDLEKLTARGLNRTTARHKEEAGAGIYRRGQRLGRLRGATTTAPHRSDQPNTAATLRYTPTVCHRHKGSTYLQGRKEDELPVITAKSVPHAKLLRRVGRFERSTRGLNPLSPERSVYHLLNDEDKRGSRRLMCRFYRSYKL